MDMALFTQICLIFNALIGVGLVFIIPFVELPQVFAGVFRLGLWVGGIGLLVQAERNYTFLSGKHLLSFDFPIWVAKDVGYWILFVGLVLFLIRTHRKV